MIALTVIFLATKKQLRMTEKFPPATKCNTIKEKYGDSLDEFAYNDYVFNEKRKENG